MVYFYLIVLPHKGAFAENHQISLEISGYTFEYTVNANETLGTYIEIPKLTSSYFTIQFDGELHTSLLCDQVSFRDCVIRLSGSKECWLSARAAAIVTYISITTIIW